MSPTTPLTLWVLLAFIVVAVLNGVPLIYTLRQMHRMKSDDSLNTLSLQLDQPVIKNKLITALTECITTAVTTHDAAPFAHPQALERYPNMDKFNGAMQRITAEVGGVRSLIEANERRRGDDMTEIRGLINESNKERKADFDELRANVSRVLGRKRDDDL